MSSVYVDPISGFTVLDVTSRKHGRFLATIDGLDAERVSAHQWHLTPNKKRLEAETFYFQAYLGRVNGKDQVVALHRFLLKAPADVLVDHKQSHNTLNNCQSNLRHATSAENNRNQQPHRNTSSKFKGVLWIKNTAKWQARIYTNYNTKFLGQFPGTPEGEIDAAKAYDKAAAEAFGEFAWINRDHFPELTETAQATA